MIVILNQYYKVMHFNILLNPNLQSIWSKFYVFDEKQGSSVFKS